MWTVRVTECVWTVCARAMHCGWERPVTWRSAPTTAATVTECVTVRLIAATVRTNTKVIVKNVHFRKRDIKMIFSSFWIQSIILDMVSTYFYLVQSISKYILSADLSCHSWDHINKTTQEPGIDFSISITVLFLLYILGYNYSTVKPC